jgi:DNA polymerase I
MAKNQSLQEALGNPSNTLYLVDISSFIFRAFYAIRHLTNKKGEPTNAIYGVATMLARLVEDANPEHLAAIYDSKEPSFRFEVYDQYKANRGPAPEELLPQFDRIEELVKCMRIHSYRQSGVEADDLIATLTKKWIAESPEHRVVVVTGDKDLMQLVNDQVLVWDTMKNKVYDSEGVIEKFGVKPEQMGDYLALVGDTSDNVPGVPGVGPKTAVQLLAEHETLDGVLKAAEEGKIKGKRGETIKASQEMAQLSRQLVALKEDVPSTLDFEELDYSFGVNEACAEFLKRMDFQSLLQRWLGITGAHVSAEFKAAEGPKAVQSPEVERENLDFTLPDKKAQPEEWSDDKFKTVWNEDDFSSLLQKIEETRRFSVDLETTSLKSSEAKIVGVAIAPDESEAFYIPLAHKNSQKVQLSSERVLAQLKPYLEDPSFGKIGQNLKYDWGVFYEYGIYPQGIEADTMVAAYVLDPTIRLNLDALSVKYLDHQCVSFEEICGKGKDQICFDEVDVEVASRYAGEDALVAMRLWAILKESLRKENLWSVYEDFDLPLVDVLLRMEKAGVCLDVPWLSELSVEFEKEIKRIDGRIQAYCEAPVNLNSPKQLAELLFEKLKLPTQSKTKTGFSTGVKVLEALAPLHEVPRLLMEYREVSKLNGTYVDPLPKLINPKTGKIHTSFHQTVTATGRLSSSDPNLQNIPIRSEKGKKIRKAFIPSEGNLLLAADYSQIELRILAHMSEDPDLLGSFQKGEDVHTRTASEIFSIPTERVDGQQRSIAKAINFGLMYGKTAFGLAQELGISRGEAKQMIDRYFQRYKGVKSFLDQLIERARKTGYTETVTGRKRALPDIRSKNAGIRNNAERMAMNTPIQGTAADLMKLAMIQLDQKLQEGKFQSKLVLQVHDEVILDCIPSEQEELSRLLVHVMEGAMTMRVPLQANLKSGPNWMEL